MREQVTRLMMKKEKYIATVVDGMLYLPDDVEYFAGKEYVVTRGLYGSLSLFTAEDWVNYEDEIQTICVMRGDRCGD